MILNRHLNLRENQPYTNGVSNPDFTAVIPEIWGLRQLDVNVSRSQLHSDHALVLVAIKTFRATTRQKNASRPVVKKRLSISGLPKDEVETREGIEALLNVYFNHKSALVRAYRASKYSRGFVGQPEATQVSVNSQYL